MFENGKRNVPEYGASLLINFSGSAKLYVNGIAASSDNSKVCQS